MNEVFSYFIDNQMASSDPFKSAENFKNKLDVIDKIVYIAEDTLFHKANDSDEELMFIRKLILRMIKNHKNSLKISIENF